nr:UTRA domain-containing protein [Kribbella sandramycini]
MRPRAAGEPDAWSEELAAREVAGSQQLREVAEVAPPVEVAEGLGISLGESVVVRRRVMLIDDQAVELTDSYYPSKIASGTGLATAKKIRGGAVTLLAELGYEAGSVQEEISARPPTTDESAALDLADGEWVLILSRLIRTTAGEPLEMSIMTMTANGRRLRYQVSS